MSARAVVFGATGTTGSLAVAALRKRGVPTLLVGRNSAKLEALADELGGGLDIAVADVTRPVSLRPLISRDDAVVSTVGPFNRFGEPVVRAAIEAGASYFDSNGEPQFTRDVFERFGGEAEKTGAALVTGFGNEYVPGNVVGGVVARQAGEAATRLEIAYLITGRLGPGSASGATLQSLAGTIFKPSFTFRDGRLVSEPVGRRRRTFPASGGKRRTAVSLGASEHFGLPSEFPWLREVDVFLGLDSVLSYGMAAGTPLVPVLARVPVLERAVIAGSERLKKSGVGPDAERRAQNGVYCVGLARGSQGNLLAQARMSGVGAYEFTGELIGWGVERALAGELRGAGALGPIAAFGLDELIAGCAESGLTLHT